MLKSDVSKAHRRCMIIRKDWKYQEAQLERILDQQGWHVRGRVATAIPGEGRSSHHQTPLLPLPTGSLVLHFRGRHHCDLRPRPGETGGEKQNGHTLRDGDSNGLEQNRSLSEQEVGWLRHKDSSTSMYRHRGQTLAHGRSMGEMGSHVIHNLQGNRRDGG